LHFDIYHYFFDQKINVEEHKPEKQAWHFDEPVTMSKQLIAAKH